MNWLWMLMLAIGVSTDVFAVSVAIGVQHGALTRSNAVRTAATFAGTSMVMPIIGWMIATSFPAHVLGGYQWIGGAALFAIGMLMVWECLWSKDGEWLPKHLSIDWLPLLALAITACVDTAVVGVALAFDGMSIVAPVITIFIVTLCVCIAGLCTGSMFRSLIGRAAEMTGGTLLMGLGSLGICL